MSKGEKGELSTLSKINQLAFRNFLEKGYESTNLRKISDEIGIKSASLYFYYKSKRELFYSILLEILEKQLQVISDVIEKNATLSSEEILYFVARESIRSCNQHSVEYKFRLRYRLFPPEELLGEIETIYHEWQDKESVILMPYMKQFLTENNSRKDINEVAFLYQYRRFLNTIIYEILIAGTMIKDEMISKHWRQFLSSVFCE